MRMELSPEEDVRLTEATESWRAEPGDWGPEWYVEPEQPSTEEIPNNTEEAGAGSGGDDAADADDAGDAGADSNADSNDADAGGVNVNSGVSAEVAATENETGSSSNPDGVFGDGFFSGLVGTVAIVGGGSSGSGVSDGGGNTSDNENDSDNGGENSNFENNTENDVGVPELGKEEESGPKWGAILAILGVGAVGLASWWFLFFGKYHLKKGERRKK